MKSVKDILVENLIRLRKDSKLTQLELAEKVGISEATECALKAVGLGHIFGFTSDFCASLGEGGLAKAVTVVGRVEIFLVAYPYFEKIIALGIKLLE